jgi:SAM-dependent methyltransferase
VDAYYTQKILAHGSTPSGVDWKSASSQELRFEQLLKIICDQNSFSIIDYGCGYGALARHLMSSGREFAYVGYDLSLEMLSAARLLNADLPQCRFAEDYASLSTADYTVASGIFNVKLDVPSTEWESYMMATLDRLYELSELGFAFNVLTNYSHSERRRSDLYYADPRNLFDYCKQRYSTNVALLHDYGLYEFTVLVRKHVREPS